MNNITLSNYDDWKSKFTNNLEYKKLSKDYGDFSYFLRNIFDSLERKECFTDALQIFKAKIVKYNESVKTYALRLTDPSFRYLQKQIFAVQVGGRLKDCNTEIHDVRFVAGRNLEATYPQLVKEWIGNPTSLHIDSFIELTKNENFELTLTTTKPQNQEKLYFVNFGAYHKGVFGEIHRFAFPVATNLSEAVVKASQFIKNNFPQLQLSSLEGRHTDDLTPIEGLETEGVDDLREITTLGNQYIAIDKSDAFHSLINTNQYIPIDLRNFHPENHCEETQKEAIIKIKDSWLSFIDCLDRANTLSIIQKLDF